MSDANNPESTVPIMPRISISTAGIQHHLSLLDTNKASGPDNITLYILKNCANEISSVLQVIFTQSLDTGVLPSDWQLANVCPDFFKKGNQANVTNYQPISLTSVCSKTMKHILYHSIMEHLNSHNNLINNQHGFHSNHTCVTQLITLVEDLSYALDQQNKQMSSF